MLHLLLRAIVALCLLQPLCSATVIARQQRVLSTSAANAPLAQSTDVPAFEAHPYPAHLPRLRLTRKAGQAEPSFKLMVVTDTHLLDDQTVPGNASNVARASVAAVEELIAMERPDFVVHLGDLVSGEAANRTADVRQAVRQIVGPMVRRRIPFATTKGNHDNDKYSTHAMMTDYEHLFAPRQSYTRKAPPGVGGGDVGSDNYWVPIFADDEKAQAPALLLWFFDSRSGKSLVQRDGTQTPVDNWVDASVGRWITEQTQAMATAWGGTVPPGLLFVHVPVHESAEAQTQRPYSDQVGGVSDETPANFTSRNLTYPGLNDDSPLDVQKFGPDRTFLRAFMKSHAGRAHVHGLVSGHDHGADWCAPNQFDNVSVPVCFAKHTGYGGYDYDNWNHGSRMFNFTPSNIGSGVQTYIRFQTGESRYDSVLDEAWSVQYKARA